MKVFRLTRIAIAALVTIVGGLSRCGAEEAVEDKTGKVFAGLADLASQESDVTQRYALLVTGEKHLLEPGKPPVIRPFHKLRIVASKRRFDYMAFDDILPMEATGRPKDYHNWTEIVRCDGNLKAYAGKATKPNRYRTKPDLVSAPDFLRENFIRGSYVDPFNDILLFATAFQSHAADNGAVEEIFLRKAKFVSSNVVLNDNVQSKWTLKLGDYDLRVTLLQGAASSYLPIEVKYESVGPYRKDFFSHTRIEWVEQSEHWLPRRVECASPTYRGDKQVVNKFFMKFDWIVGDEVPDDFVRCNSDDFRRPLLDHFEVEYDFIAHGRTFYAKPWQRPDDLYMGQKRRAEVK
ncbi:secreted protein [Rhodopirellula maiorica SM1]|uniref:Secreted protein n=1 Tax=Rhodopirellula maiorica SM1 TaxID=1265738 RepID=M5RPK9_9BACT|nr:hypothetical protein [Rhodopirellula maiorica]EMI15894.1 secreted protein [Rhodopirellula maiorica SM1]